MSEPGTSFYLLGDSICYGQLISPHLIWVARLSKALEEVSTEESPILLQNASLNGNTTRQALERMAYDITSHGPDFVWVQFGMNDCNYWATDKGVPRVSKQAFAANLEEIVERALAAGAKRVFLSTNHPSLKGAFAHMDSLSYDQSNAEYNGIIRETHAAIVARGLPVVLNDNEAAWKKRLSEDASLTLDQLLLPDRIHLSLEGHQLYAETVIPLVLANLEEN